MRVWLRSYRESKGLTQMQTAAKSGISRSYYTLIEAGIKTPTVNVAKDIAKTLGFDWYIFFDTDSSLKEQSYI